MPVVAVLPYVRAKAQESGRLYPVDIKEANDLRIIYGRIISAVLDGDNNAANFQILDDNTVTYSVGDGMFSRSWQVNADGEIELGQPQEVEMVAQPVSQSAESARSDYQSLYEASKVINPGRSESFHLQFALGRNGSYRPGASFQEAMAGISESLNPGRSGKFHEAFAKGRGGSGNLLRDLGETLGYDGVKLEEFIKGRD
jgi:hypothetical protein